MPHLFPRHVSASCRPVPGLHGARTLHQAKKTHHLWGGRDQNAGCQDVCTVGACYTYVHMNILSYIYTYMYLYFVLFFFPQMIWTIGWYAMISTCWIIIIIIIIISMSISMSISIISASFQHHFSIISASFHHHFSIISSSFQHHFSIISASFHHHFIIISASFQNVYLPLFQNQTSSSIPSLRLFHPHPRIRSNAWKSSCFPLAPTFEQWGPKNGRPTAFWSASGENTRPGGLGDWAICSWRFLGLGGFKLGDPSYDQQAAYHQIFRRTDISITASPEKSMNFVCPLMPWQVVSPTDLKRIKDAWDVDEEGDFDEFEEDLWGKSPLPSCCEKKTDVHQTARWCQMYGSGLSRFDVKNGLFPPVSSNNLKGGWEIAELDGDF